MVLSVKEPSNHMLSDLLWQALEQAFNHQISLLLLVSASADSQAQAIQTIAAEWQRRGGTANHVHCPPELMDFGGFYASWRVLWRSFFELADSDSDRQKRMKIEQRLRTLCPEFPETILLLQRLLVLNLDDEQIQRIWLRYRRESESLQEPLRREAEALDALSPEQAASAAAQQRREHFYAAIQEAGRQQANLLLSLYGLATDVLADTTVKVLRAATEQTPMLIAFEGIHHMSATSLQLLAYIVQSKAAVPLLFVGTHGTDLSLTRYVRSILHPLEHATVVTL
jgi:hypothetical protein